MIEYKQPDQLRPDEINQFVEFVKEYGHIPNINNIRTGVRNAEVLFRKFNGSTLLGIAAVKRPLASYKKRIFTSVGSRYDYKSFALELGYIAVRPDHTGRGIGDSLIKIAVVRIANRAAFATSRESNNWTSKHLAKYGFVQEDKSYGEGSDKFLLFIRKPSLT